MKPLVCISLMLNLPLLCHPTFALADAATQVKAVIQAEDDKGDAAYERKDVAGCLAFSPPTYTHIGLDGKQTTLSKDQMREALQSLFASALSIRSKSTVQSVTLVGGKATVIEKAKTIFVVSHSGQNFSVTSNSVERQLWIKSGPHWLEQKSWTLSRNTSTAPAPDATKPTSS